jgi:hypothetical protein
VMNSRLDHLVGAGEQCRRNVDADPLRRFEIDHQLELDGLLHWEVGRLFAVKNATSIDPLQPVLFRDATTVADKSARCGELAGLKYRRQRIFQGKCAPSCSARLLKNGSPLMTSPPALS